MLEERYPLHYDTHLKAILERNLIIGKRYNKDFLINGNILRDNYKLDKNNMKDVKY